DPPDPCRALSPTGAVDLSGHQDVLDPVAHVLRPLAGVDRIDSDQLWLDAGGLCEHRGIDRAELLAGPAEKQSSKPTAAVVARRARSLGDLYGGRAESAGRSATDYRGTRGRAPALGL